MKRGAFVMFDALGFKGIWNRPEFKDHPERVIDKLHELKRSVLEKEKDLREALGDVDGRLGLSSTPRVTMLSDTIAVGIFAEVAPGSEYDDGAAAWVALVMASAICAHITMAGALMVPPFIYRGCVAFGRFDMDEQFVVGQAVDEAAENMNLAEAAVVWFCPSAREVFDTNEGRLKWGSTPFPITKNWAVPIKGGTTYTTHVVNPFSPADNDDEVERLQKAILHNAFDSSRLDIQIKRQNTARFLLPAKTYVSRFLENRRKKKGRREQRAAFRRGAWEWFHRSIGDRSTAS